MDDIKAAELLKLLSEYAAEYEPDTTVKELAADLIDTLPDRLLPARPVLEVWGFDYDA